MMAAHPMTTARSRFFDDQSLDRPLKNSDWRGCVLDRDKFSNVRLPEGLWRALMDAANISEVQVCGYFQGAEGCTGIASSWEEFSCFMLAPQNYSPEYLVFDCSERWAILADSEVTTVAMERELAGLVDLRLSHCGASLLSLTLDSFSMESILSKNGAYVRGILGTNGSVGRS